MYKTYLNAYNTKLLQLETLQPTPTAATTRTGLVPEGTRQGEGGDVPSAEENQTNLRGREMEGDQIVMRACVTGGMGG